MFSDNTIKLQYTVYLYWLNSFECICKAFNLEIHNLVDRVRFHFFLFFFSRDAFCPNVWGWKFNLSFKSKSPYRFIYSLSSSSSVMHGLFHGISVERFWKPWNWSTLNRQITLCRLFINTCTCRSISGLS